MKRTHVLSAAAALLFVATAAQAQRGRDDRHGRQDQHGQATPQEQQRQGGADRRGGEVQQRTDWGRDDQARAEQARADQARAEQARAAAEQNQRRAVQQNDQWRDRQQNDQWRDRQQNDQWRDRQNREAQQQEQLERARRAEQEAQLERERQAQVNRAYDRDRDDRSVYRYRYNLGGVYRETNGYGADVLRQAVNQGYDQGYRAGLIDRRDGARADFRRALDFESGGYGYTGTYVPEGDYAYYFREGFQRGYDDGYWNRSQYGTFSNGKAAILGAIALGILGVTLIH